MPVRPCIIPCLVYCDAPAAIDFLCEAFGFTRNLVVPGEAVGEIAHAQLVLDGNMLMLSTASQGSHDRFGMVPPGVTGGLVTGCICINMDDPDAHYARAVAHGAEIIGTPHNNPYGGRGYEARDPEGYIWSFGSYDPWAEPG